MTKGSRTWKQGRPLFTSRSSPMMILTLRFRLLKLIVKTRHRLLEWWNSNSGDWIWLTEKALPLAGLNRNLWRSAVPSLSFHMLLMLSGVISTLGLLADSAATIIGAMIIAPLMGPIISIAFAIVVSNRRLLKRSSLTLITGVVLTLATSYLVCQSVGLRSLGSEVLGRVRPSLIDLGVALAAGAAGAFAKSRRSIADALPGVAIAVALVPPLSVVGIGLAVERYDVSSGAALLFLANAVGIIFSGAVVFLAQGYGSLERARRGLFVSIATLAFLGLPLGLSLQQLIVRERARSSIYYLISQKTLTFAQSDIRQLYVQYQRERLIVSLEVAAPFGSISQNQVKLVKEFLEKELNRPITLNVRLIPITQFDIPAD